MNFHIRSLLVAAVLLLPATNSFAFQPPDRAALPNLDRRTDGASTNNVASGNRQAAVERLRMRLPRAQVEFDQVSGAPKFISAGDQFLSGTNGQGNAVSTTVAAKFAVTDPYRPTKAFIQEHRELFGHDPQLLDKARIKREFVDPHSGLKTVVWEQQLDGVPLFECVLISHATAKAELVNISSQFLPDPEAAANLGVTNRAAVIAAPDFSARQAVVIAARNITEKIDEQGVIAEQETNGAALAGPEKRQFFTSANLKGKAEAKLIWLPMSQNRLRLCWDVVLMSRSRGEMFRVLVDAQTGEPLVRRCLTDYISAATYRVYTSDSPSPFSPGYTTPVTTQPPLTNRVLVTFSALNTNASPNGWIDDGGNETLGNNVDAHTDLNADNVADLPRPHGSPSRVFDFPLDLIQSPATYTNAAVVQLFYWNNFMHDKLYELGFTEAAGNFQSNNFGRGGAGNDAVQADAQDGSGFNNANFSTPPDGSPGRMQMYLFNGPLPNRDGDLDAEVVLHEYTHGLSNRRVGGGVGISALQSAGMGEGWSDFYAMALLSEPGDDVNGVYAYGGYVTYQLSGLTQNYYFGIRRYPYCTDMNKNPLTFKDIDPTQASSHTGIPRSPIIGTTANEVHNMGEVWCVTLREARANLITKYGWAVGNQLILQLVTDGMNLSPANPNFLQARNAILQADQVDTGGANQFELWSAFAKRGMGLSATSPASSTSTGVVEAFDSPLLPLRILVPVNATEGDGVLIGAGQVQLQSLATSNIIVTLSSSKVSEVTVPPTVTVPTGQSNAVFNLTIIDDAVLDGTQTSTITGSATGYATGSTNIAVFDNETATLQVSLPASAAEGQGSITGAVQVSAVPATNIVVSLFSSDTTEIQVPATVIIPFGQTSAVFTATVVDDNEIDGPQIATVTAHVQNWTDGSTNLTVLDNEDLNLFVILPVSALENAGVLTNAGIVRISGTLTTNLLVSLSSSAVGKLTVPATVTITAGTLSNAFNVTLVDNSIADGQQTVTVTASATGFTNGSGSMLVVDDESPTIPFNPQPGNFATNVPANTNLMWSNSSIVSGSNQLILNGGFETGTFINWVKTNISSFGDWAINNGAYDPPGPEVPTPPFAGSFSAVSEQTGGGTHTLYQDVTIPSSATSAVLTWTDRIRNFATQFTATSQYFHVEIRGTNNNVLQIAFTTNPGDSLTNNWVTRNFNLLSYAGQKIRIAFVELDTLGYFNVGLDNVSLQVNTSSITNSSGTVTNDIYFGTNPTPGLAEFQGSTTNSSWALPLLSPQTTYYWQIVAHKTGSATGAVWQFTTAGVDHFVWNTISSPQFAGQSFGVTITAKDAFNSIVSNFSGTASLHAGGGSGLGEIFRANFESGLQGFTVSNTFGLGNGLWHLSTGRAAQAGHTPSSSLYYGTGEGPNGGGTYNNGLANEGIITSPTIDLSAASAPLTLSFNCLIQSEPGTAWDHATVEISTNNGAAYAVICGNNQGGVLFGTDSSGLWITVSNNLSSYAGRQIKLRLHFNTIDSGANGYEGWYVDDIVIFSGTTNTPTAITPPISSLFTNGVWTGNITVQQPATNVVLQADDGNGHTGNSNPFNVVLTNDISMSMVDSPDPVSVGANLTYTLTVANTGPLDATGVMVTNILPAGVNFVSAVSSQGTCSQSGGIITCDLGVVSGATNATVTIVAVPMVAGVTITNTAIVSRAEADGYLGNNSASVVTTVTTPAISIADASVVEGNVGITNMLFAVTLAAPSAQTITVHFATSNSTATAGSDYIATNGTLTFAPGITNATIAVMVVGDISVETNEAFFVSLSNPVNGVLGRAQAVGIIVNDDGFPGNLDHFVWSAIASPQFVNESFNATITALDVSNNIATNFNGVAAFSGTNVSITPTVSDNFTNGIWSGGITILQRATNIVLRADDGNGHSGLSNPFDVVPDHMPPIILSQPTNQTVIAGRAAAFAVAGDGTPPLIYQWNFNGTNILGATNATLTLTNVQFSDAGLYAVQLTNAYGSTVSSNATLAVVNVPVIISFSPITGSAGTVIAIRGNGFDPTTSNNIVYFGAVQASVSTASVTNLTVTVPAGATFAPITETVNGLTASANQLFLPTFGGDGSGINASSFAARQDLASGSQPCQVTIADLDGDGKPDLAGVNLNDHTVSIYRNISTNGVLNAGSFAPHVDLSLPIGTNGGSPYFLTTADVDGDGKLDLIACEISSSRVSIFRNISTAGSLTTNSFALPVGFSVGADCRYALAADVDGDGRLDIIAANFGGNTMSILQNIGSPGSLSFAPQVTLACPAGPYALAIDDLDGDGKLDLAVATGNFVSLFRNTGTVGVIDTNSFASRVDLPPTSGLWDTIKTGDVDGDGKTDLVLGSYENQSISVFRNIASLGSLSTNSFATHVDFVAGTHVHTVSMGDFNGDGKPDIIAVGEIPSQMSVFQNVSTPGSFTNASLAGRVDFSTGSNPFGVAVGDLDGDGRPDAVFANFYDATVSIYQNMIPLAVPPTITSQPANQIALGGSNVIFAVTASGTPPLNYFWQKNNSLLPGASNASLTLLNVVRTNSGNYSVVITNIAGSVTSSNAALLVHVPQHLGTPVLLPDGILTFTSSDLDGGVISSSDLPNLQAQASTNLVNWINLTNALTLTNGMLQLQDSDSTNVPARFYRIMENW